MYWILFVTFVTFSQNAPSNSVQSTFVMWDEAACTAKMKEYNSGKYNVEGYSAYQTGKYTAQCIQSRRS